MLDQRVRLLDKIPVRFRGDRTAEGPGGAIVMLFIILPLLAMILVLPGWLFVEYRRRVRLRLLSELAWATERNLPLDPLLVSLKREAWDGIYIVPYLGWRSIVEGLRVRLNSGALLSEACWPWRRFFGATRLALLREAERAGRLDVALRSTVDLLREEDRTRFEARGILLYPLYMLFLVMAFVLVLTAIMLWIHPTFLKVLDDVQTAPSSSLVALGIAFRWAVHWDDLIALLVVVILAVLIVRSGGETRNGGWLLLPGLGSLFRLAAARNFCEVMGALAGQGTTLLEALRGASGAAAYVPYRAMAQRLADGVGRGETFADLVVRERLLPPLAREMLALGVRAGLPADAFRRAATHLGGLLAVRQRVLFFALGATFVIVVGFFVAWVGTAVMSTLTEIQMHLLDPSAH